MCVGVHKLHYKRVSTRRQQCNCCAHRNLTRASLHRASDKCSKEKRKTINGDDLLWAMSALGFEEYVEPLKMYLHKYREVTSTLRPRAMQQLATPADTLGDLQGEKASLAKQGQDANGLKKEEVQSQSHMYMVRRMPHACVQDCVCVMTMAKKQQHAITCAAGSPSEYASLRWASASVMFTSGYVGLLGGSRSTDRPW